MGFCPALDLLALAAVCGIMDHPFLLRCFSLLTFQMTPYPVLSQTILIVYFFGFLPPLSLKI